MPLRRSLVLIAVLAALHGLFFIWYQRPDWSTEWAWPDQDGYRRLGEVLARTGKFTRFPDAPRFVPEVLRTPLYPLFVAAVYRVFGVRQVAVALAQDVVFVLIVLVVYGIARRIAAPRIAIAAAAAVALFPPIPYFAALVMTEVWTTFLLTLSMWVLIRATDTRQGTWRPPKVDTREGTWRPPSGGPGRNSQFAALGALLAMTTLSRPVFVLFPIALAAVGLVMWQPLRVRPRPAFRHWAWMFATFAIAMLPWLTYNRVTLGRFTVSPAGGVGRGLWEGSWQAVFSGRVQNELTHLADDTADGVELDRRVEAVAEREHLAPAPMLDYVHQWKDIRRIWVEPVDPYERALARVRADEEYRRTGLANIRRDSAVHLLKRLARGAIVLWAAEIPIRYSAINRLPPAVIYLLWAIQVAIFLAAIGGVVALVRSGAIAPALWLAAPIVYITAVHLPLLTEARQSLPAQPVLLLLATIGVASAAGDSFTLKPQVHEREHL